MLDHLETRTEIGSLELWKFEMFNDHLSFDELHVMNFVVENVRNDFDDFQPMLLVRK